MSSQREDLALVHRPQPVEKWWVMLGIGLGVLMYTIDTSIVNIALPTLVQDLRTDFATVQWVGLSYVLVVTSLVLGAARLGDLLGKKPLYLGGLIVFTMSSLLCGWAPSIAILIGARALQGLGAVMISALGAAIIVEVFPTAERGKALGIIGAVVSMGIALGPSIGGVLIDTPRCDFSLTWGDRRWISEYISSRRTDGRDRGWFDHPVMAIGDEAIVKICSNSIALKTQQVENNLQILTIDLNHI
jgi:MFS family permease